LGPLLADLCGAGTVRSGACRRRQKVQELRELSHYEAQSVSLAEAERVIGTAERFVTAVGEMYPD
jgi:hypothetical protein